MLSLYRKVRDGGLSFFAVIKMEAARLLERRWARVVLLIAVWTAFGLLLASQTGLSYRRREMPVSWHRILIAEMAFAYTWAALTPLILWLSKRFRIERARWKSALAVHVIASLLLGFATRLLRDLLFIFVVAEAGSKLSWASLLMMVYFFFDYGAMIYWLVLLVSYAVDYYKRYQEGEVKASRLETQLAQAQLHALKMQLHPHFLFNTLNSISALVHKDVESADKMIARLGDFLRLTLENAGSQEVSLQQELEFLKCYLEIERIRFADRLAVRMDIEPDALDARLPNLVLQPIVENAIRHGIAPQTGPGRIDIEANRVNGTLRVRVTDNGPGIPLCEGYGLQFREGLGLANTEARLEQLYGDEHRLDLQNATAGGLTVTLEIPFKQFHLPQN